MDAPQRARARGHAPGSCDVVASAPDSELRAGLILIVRDLARTLGAEVSLLGLADPTGESVEVVAAAGTAAGRDELPLLLPGGFVGRALGFERAALEAIEPEDSALGSPASGARVTHAVGAAVRPFDGPAGALCAGFSTDPPRDLTRTLWLVDSYARLASLCLQDREALTLAAFPYLLSASEVGDPHQVRFCGHCGDRPVQEVSARVCVSCGLGVLLSASADTAPASEDAFLVLDETMRVGALSRHAQSLLGIDEGAAVERHIDEFLTPADPRSPSVATLDTGLARSARGGSTPRNLEVRLRTGNVRLRARIGPCGPPPATLIVLVGGAPRPGTAAASSVSVRGGYSGPSNTGPGRGP